MQPDCKTPMVNKFFDVPRSSLTFPWLASSVNQGDETRTRQMPANSRSACNVLSRFHNRYKHTEWSEVNECHGTGPHSSFDLGTRSSFLGSLSRGLCPPPATSDSLTLFAQTQRTIAVIKALGAVAPAIVSRDVYYAGAKHLIPILQLLIPGIDLVCHSLLLLTPITQALF